MEKKVAILYLATIIALTSVLVYAVTLYFMFPQSDTEVEGRVLLEGIKIPLGEIIPDIEDIQNRRSASMITDRNVQRNYSITIDKIELIGDVKNVEDIFQRLVVSQLISGFRSQITLDIHVDYAVIVGILAVLVGVSYLSRLYYASRIVRKEE